MTIGRDTKAVSGKGEKLLALRTALGLGQLAFAKSLGVNQASIPRWENNLRPIPIATILKVAALAPPDQAPDWLGLAGVRGAFLSKHATRIEEETVSIPLLKDAAAAGEPSFIDDEIEGYLSLPSSLCPRSRTTRCVKVKGESMSPVIRDGYIAAIDIAQQDARDLIGEMVAAGNPEGGVTLKWLRKSGSQYLLVPQHTSPRYNPVVLSEDKRWRIIGRVIWWIGFPPPKK